MNYYKRVIELSAQFAGSGSAIEIGAGRSKMLECLTWADTKVAIDLERKPTIAGALNIQADFMKYKPKQSFNLVICLQVLEHLSEPEVFLDKLFSCGKIVLISVPYCWPAGFCSHHLQDPIDEQKVLGWAKKEWIHHEIVEDDQSLRLIAVFSESMA